MPDLSDFTCAVTGYEGFESEILRLRNANRVRHETLDYVRWRYRHVAQCPTPLIFWLVAPEGTRIGMASVIFRLYWIVGTPTPVAVVGDISLDERWRGKGLGGRLMKYMTEHLDRNFPGFPAFVIPTETARRALVAAGWVTVGTLVQHVLLLDATRRLQSVLHIRWLALRIAWSLKGVLGALVRRYVLHDASLRLQDVLDPTLQQAALSNERTGGVARDLGQEFLEWRYAQHTRTRFRYAVFTRATEVRGFLVFEEERLGTWSIYDLVAQTMPDLRAMLALFVLRGLSTPGLETLRIMLSERHPYRIHLRSLGFVARHKDAVCQVHSASGTAERLVWSITQGDKDT